MSDLQEQAARAVVGVIDLKWDDLDETDRKEAREVADAVHEVYAPLVDALGNTPVFFDIAVERQRQELTWGEQNHPDGTGGHDSRVLADLMRKVCDKHTAEGSLTWRDILREEVAEVFAETVPAQLRTELVQVAAVATAWVQAIDRRESSS